MKDRHVFKSEYLIEFIPFPGLSLLCVAANGLSSRGTLFSAEGGKG